MLHGVYTNAGQHRVPQKDVGYPSLALSELGQSLGCLLEVKREPMGILEAPLFLGGATSLCLHLLRKLGATHILNCALVREHIPEHLW